MGEFDLIRRYFTRPAAAPAAGRGRRLRTAGSPPPACNGHFQRHAGRGTAFLCRHQPRAPGPQGPGGQPLGPGRLRRPAAGFTLALALPEANEAWLQAFAQGLLAAGRRARLRAGGRRHHARATEPVHHRVWRSAHRPGAAAQRCAGRRRHLRERHLGDARLALEALLGHPACRSRTAGRARQRWSSPRRAWPWAWRCAALPAVPST
jgi:thiamine-monophosphate kinase